MQVQMYATMNHLQRNAYLLHVVDFDSLLLCINYDLPGSAHILLLQLLLLTDNQVALRWNHMACREWSDDDVIPQGYLASHLRTISFSIEIDFIILNMTP